MCQGRSYTESGGLRALLRLWADRVPVVLQHLLHPMGPRLLCMQPLPRPLDNQR